MASFTPPPRPENVGILAMEVRSCRARRFCANTFSHLYHGQRFLDYHDARS